MPTENRFTGQKEDAAGLVYMNARYYDPVLGQFISPDTIVPDAANLFDYNRYMYVRGNPLRFTDPSVHCLDGISTVFCAIVAAAAIGAAANATGNVVGQFIEQYDRNRNLLENLQSTPINGQEVAIAAGWGAVGGGAAPVTGPVGFVVANAFAGAGQKITTDMVVDGKSLEESIRDPNTAVAAFINAAGAKLGGQVPKVPLHVANDGQTILYATGQEAVMYGGERFADTTSKMLWPNRWNLLLHRGQALLRLLPTCRIPHHRVVLGSGIVLTQFVSGGNVNQPEPCTVDPNDQYQRWQP